MIKTKLQSRGCTFSSPQAALLLVSTKNRDLWPGPTPEVRDSRTSRHSAHVQSHVWEIWLVLVSLYCVFKAIQKRNVVGQGQRSRFLVLTKRSAASEDENGGWIIIPETGSKGLDWGESGDKIDSITSRCSENEPALDRTPKSGGNRA